MQSLDLQFLDQAVILAFLIKVVALIFIGAGLTVLIAVIIWVMSGGNEDRNDMSVKMIKSALSLMALITVFYFAIVFYAKYMGISLS